jgi:TetR/AcrR family transcriptional repressor of nem operon
MGRPKSFDREEVLDRAMAVFWRKGYGATSIRDLVEATGLNPGSLYDSFEDKHGLFLEAVARYRRTVVARRLQELQRPGPALDRIEAFFEDVVRFSLGEGRLLGCLMTNSAIELAPRDRDAAVAVAANFAEIEAAFRQVLRRAREAGEIAADRPVEDLARYLTSGLQGLRVMAKAQPDEAALRAVVRLMLAALD